MVLVMVLCANAEASDWKGYFKVDWDAVGDYATEKWKDASDYVGGLFNGKSKDVPAKPEAPAKKESPKKAEAPAKPEVPDNDLPSAVAEGWDKFTETLTDTLTLRDKQEKLPSKSWIPFKETQSSNAKKINALLDTALGFLVKGDASEIRRAASQLRDAITRNKQELDNLRNKRITAPDESSLPWRLTKSAIDKKIAKLQDETAYCEEGLSGINATLAVALKEIGLSLNSSQVEILLNSVTGDDIMQNAIVFSNVKAVVEKLEELAQNDTNTLDITRRYTGMYLVLNDLLIHTQEELVRKIDEDYKPKLKGIITEADSLRKDALAKSTQSAYSKEQRKGFMANAQSNELTIQVAKLYTELLDAQRAGTMDSLKSLKLNRDLAENTYRTVRSSWELKGLIHTGLKVFEAVSTMKMPELKVFESGVMRLEFEEINRRLRKQ